MYSKKISIILLIIFSLSLITSCNKDYYSVGMEILDQQFQDLKSETFPVFTYQESLDKDFRCHSLHLVIKTIIRWEWKY